MGRLTLDGSAGPVTITGAKARQMLTVLAFSVAQHVTTDQLIDALWLDPPSSATKTVQSHASRLRRALADAGAADALRGDGAGYRLDLGDRLDTHELARLTRSAEAAREGGDALLAAELYAQARDLWRGEPELPDTPTADGLRRRLRDQRLELAVAHLAALIDAGRAATAVAELGQLVLTDRLNERLWELRILALYRSGRPTDALRAYHEIATLLAEEIGVMPGPALHELESQILSHDAADTAPTTPTGPTRRHHAGDVAYTHAAGAHIAHRCFGNGETPVLLFSPGLLSIDAILDEHRFASAIGRLAHNRRVIAFDPRGIGLSDRTQPVDTITIDHWVDDACAVIDANAISPVHIFASGHGGLTALTLAARHPHRVRSLTLFNAFARFVRDHDYPHGPDPEAFASIQASIRRVDPGPGIDALTLISPSVAGDVDYRDWWNAAGRRAASPAAAATLIRMMSRSDVRHLLPAIAAPTLVIVRDAVPIYDANHGRYLAAHIHGAALIEQHDFNDPWFVGDTNVVTEAIDHFLTSLA